MQEHGPTTIGKARLRHRSRLPAPEMILFAKGADISWVTEMEAAGHRFYNADGKQLECTA